MSIIDVVAWSGRDYNDQTYAWRFPETELSTWTQLLVNESQEAVLYRSGALDGPFGPGRRLPCPTGDTCDNPDGWSCLFGRSCPRAPASRPGCAAAARAFG